MKLIKIERTTKHTIWQFLLIILTIGVHSAHAQEGYLVTLAGDTVRGTVVFGGVQNNVETVYVTPTGEKKRQPYLATKVRTVYSDPFFYRTLKNQIYRFMRIEQDGYLSLLKFKSLGGQSFNNAMLYKADGSMLEVSRVSFKGAMTEFVGDCGTLGEKISSKELGWKNLNEIVAQYNACIEQGSFLQDPDLEPVAKAEPVISANNSQTVSLLEIIDEIENEFTQGADPSEDFSAIVADFRGKISKQQEIPSYLVNALRSEVSSSPNTLKLVDKLESTLKSPVSEP